MALGAAGAIGAIALLMTGGQGSTDRLVGSGSTFAQPLIERAAVDFQTARAGDRDWTSGSAGIDYEPVGSLGGIMRLRDPEVDFAVADYPLSPEALKSFGAVQFPIVIGSISPVYNLKSVAAPLRLGPAALASIFSGRVRSWADPVIAADNPGVTLPDTPIVVVYRQDGSGSTLNWSTYLAQNDAAWKARIGAGTTLRWPAGVGVKGGNAMADAVAARDGAIGYLETGQARRAGLSTAALQSPAGGFVDASEANVLAGARQAGLLGKALPGNAPANAYPVVTASYIIMKRENRAPRDNERALRFANFLLAQDGASVRALGYLPLTPESVAEVRRIWSQEFKFTPANTAS